MSDDREFDHIVWKSTNSNHITPFWFYKELDEIFHFDLDAATDEDNPQGTRKYYTPKDNSLVQSWSGTVWLNPPYSRKKSEPADFIAKAYKESLKPDCQVVMLLASRTGNKWMQDLIFPLADGILFIRGRLKFEGEEHSAPFDSILVFYGMNDSSYINEVSKYGYYINLKELRRIQSLENQIIDKDAKGCGIE